MKDTFGNCPVRFVFHKAIAEVEPLTVLFKVSYNAAVNVSSPVTVVNEVIVYLFHTNSAVIADLVKIFFPYHNGVVPVPAVSCFEMPDDFSSAWQWT